MKNYFCIILVCIASFSIAQEFKTSVVVGTGVSWINSTNSNVYSQLFKNDGNKICFSTTIEEEYYLPKVFSFGIEANYLNMPGSAVIPINEINIAGSYSYYNHSLSIHSVDVPFVIKLRTQNKMSKVAYLFGGFGFSYIALANETVEIRKGTTNSEKAYEIIPIADGKTKLKSTNNNSIGTFSVFGIGKNFVIKNNSFFCEFRYRFDNNSWLYPTPYNSEHSSISLKRQLLSFNLGYTFGKE